MGLKEDLQKKIAAYAREAAYPVTKGNRFLGSDRKIHKQIEECKCGICVKTAQTMPKCKQHLVQNGLQGSEKQLLEVGNL